jgi:hypothetical protein
VGGFGSHSAVGSSGDIGGAAVHKAELHIAGYVGGERGHEGKALPQPMTQVQHPAAHHQPQHHSTIPYPHPQPKRSPNNVSPMTSASPILHTVPSFHNNGAAHSPPISELHTESMASPVSELGTTSPLVRTNDAVELGDEARKVVEMDASGGGLR